MKYWDASAIVALLVPESASAAVADIVSQDPVMLVWWGTPVECASAIARRERDGVLSVVDATAALERLRALGEAWQEILPVDAVRRRALRLLRVHALRAADALQLAAALTAADGEPEALPLVSLDDRLNEAAAREGFLIVPT